MEVVLAIIGLAILGAFGLFFVLLWIWDPPDCDDCGGSPWA